MREKLDKKHPGVVTVNIDHVLKGGDAGKNTLDSKNDVSTDIEHTTVPMRNFSDIVELDDNKNFRERHNSSQ